MGEIRSPLVLGKKDQISVHYFAELSGMKGVSVYHEWFLNDQLVFVKKVTIDDDLWRTASRQLVGYAKNNQWRVKLLDETKQVLDEKIFTVTKKMH